MIKSKKKITLKDKVLRLIKDKEWGKVSEELLKDFLKNNSVVTVRDDVKSEIWIYVDGIYLPQGKSYLKEYLRDVLGNFYSQYIANLVIAKLEVDTFMNQDQFFSQNNKWEIPVLNGVLHLKTRKLRKYDSKKDVFFSKLSVNYDPKAKCPKIDKHFEDVLKNPTDKEVLYELIGYGLFKDHFIEKCFMFVGGGRNGKGKTLELIKLLLNPKNCCCVPLNCMKEDSFNLHQLFGKLMNLAGDLNNTDLKDTGLLKSITGRDLITAHRKFLTDINFVSYCKNVFACNDLPKVYDLSKGFWSRWILLEFPYEFIPKKEYDKLSDTEKEFKKIIDVDHIQHITSPKEMSGLLNSALDGLDRLHKQKEFSYTIGTNEIKDLWVRRSNSFMAFCMDCLEEDYKGQITKFELRRAFSGYCKYFKLKGCSDKEINITLQNLFGSADSRVVVNGNVEHVWLGIKSCQDYQGFLTYKKGTSLSLRSKNHGNAGRFENPTQENEVDEDNEM